MKSWSWLVLCAVIGALVGFIGYSALNSDEAKFRKAFPDYLQILAEDNRKLSQRLDGVDAAVKELTRVDDVNHQELKDLHIQVDEHNRVLARKLPAQETGWITNRFDRHEQRIGALEYERWKQR